MDGSLISAASQGVVAVKGLSGTLAFLDRLGMRRKNELVNPAIEVMVGQLRHAADHEWEKLWLYAEAVQEGFLPSVEQPAAQGDPAAEDGKSPGELLMCDMLAREPGGGYRLAAAPDAVVLAALEVVAAHTRQFGWPCSAFSFELRSDGAQSVRFLTPEDFDERAGYLRRRRRWLRDTVGHLNIQSSLSL